MCEAGCGAAGPTGDTRSPCRGLPVSAWFASPSFRPSLSLVPGFAFPPRPLSTPCCPTGWGALGALAGGPCRHAPSSGATHAQARAPEASVRLHVGSAVA